MFKASLIIFCNGELSHISASSTDTTADKAQYTYATIAGKGKTTSIQKIGGYTVSLNHSNTQIAAEKIIDRKSVV